MKLSNLAVRLDDAPTEAALPHARSRPALQVLAVETDAVSAVVPPRRRRAFSERLIEIRDQGFRPFRVS